MRADRLLSMLMILQSRGKTGAQDLASELEVSKRTVYRDVIALSTSGVPVYTEKGPGGGIALVERYRSDLTGLTKDEVRALFMMSVPPALTELGLDQQLRAAMFKLSSALPSTMREDEQSIRQRIYIDPTPWEDKPPRDVGADLQSLQDALWRLKVINITHKSWLRPDLEPLQAVVHPYGLVAKDGNWYLISKREDHIGVIRVDQIVEVRSLDETFLRPDGFDLVAFWRSYCEGELKNRPAYPVMVLVEADKLPWISWSLGEMVRLKVLKEQGPDPGGVVSVEMVFEHFYKALKGLLPLGGAVEVIEPAALRCSIKDYAEQILLKYV